MTSATPDIPVVLDVPAVATILGCGDRTVRNLIATGALRSVRLGRLIRVPREALIDFLNPGTPTDEF